jgi:hypothetical protein
LIITVTEELVINVVLQEPLGLAVTTITILNS